jgi:glycosyltransferase involved in cell wall biosynthesis
MRFTILTPTYNRAYTLTRLYESLKEQTFQDFEWLVVDDGSKDDTEALIKSFIEEKPFFPIQYLKTENGGKHRAINRGLPYAKGELTFLLDSDDWLMQNALKIVDEIEKSVNDRDNIIGFGGQKIFDNNQLIGATFVGDFIDILYTQRTKYNVQGDKTDIYYTELLKKYPFPDFEGEKFATERLVWNEMARDGYKVRYFNQPVQYCEYLEDGLTAGGYEMYAKYPRQWGLAIWQDYQYSEKGFKQWYHNTQQLYVYYLYTKDSLSIKEMSEYLKVKRFSIVMCVAMQTAIDAVRWIVNRGETMRKGR